MQLHLTKVVRTTTNKQGDTLKTKDGRAYTRISIKTEEHGEKWLSGFDGPVTKAWKEGDVVEATVEQKGEYLNFSVPKPIDKVDDKLETVLNKLTGIIITLAKIEGLLTPKKAGVPDSAYPTNEFPEEDPF